MSHLQERLEGLRNGWTVCKAQDDQKQALITDLFAYINELSSKLSDADNELRDKKDVIIVLREREDGADKQIQALELEKARHVFASVLIDGDCMPFKDELVRQGMEGGKRIASLLKRAVEEELQSSPLSTVHHVQVKVRVYANVKGLAKTYKDMEVIPQATFFDDFIRGFNMGNTMCDYVDAGDGKECADEKVKANFRHDLADVHCQQVLFGGTADNGYARLLGPFIEDETARRRITLLEGPPFAHELADIKDKFRTVSFENIFRSQKLVNIKRRVSFHLTPPSTPSADYATAATRASSTPIPASVTPQSSFVPGKTVTAGILQNKWGQRVDAPLRYSQQDFANLKGRKLCNTFHLLGRCPYTEKFGNCRNDHGEKLNDRQMMALRAVARQSPCSSKLDCVDRDCLCGHRCTRDKCPRTNCWFPLDMHDVDTSIVNQN